MRYHASAVMAARGRIAGSGKSSSSAASVSSDATCTPLAMKTLSMPARAAPVMSVRTPSPMARVRSRGTGFPRSF